LKLILKLWPQIPLVVGQSISWKVAFVLNACVCVCVCVGRPQFAEKLLNFFEKFTLSTSCS